VPDKNWRPFWGSLSLVDLNIQALRRAGFDASAIYVSCESAERLARVNRQWGVIPLPRDPGLCDNAVPLTDWIRQICAQVPGDDDLAWSQVCDPLFDEHRTAMEAWNDAKAAGHDSLCVVHPFRAYLLDEHFCPFGWQWGEWHTPSQYLPQLYTFPFTMSILTRSAVDRTGYHIGARPYWYVSSESTVDIDTPDDFEYARYKYAENKS
jgi:CMP-N-acetylneuraminic acid synthetase